MINILSKQNIFFTALAQFQDIRSYLRDVNTFRAVKLKSHHFRKRGPTINLY